MLKSVHCWTTIVVISVAAACSGPVLAQTNQPPLLDDKWCGGRHYRPNFRIIQDEDQNLQAVFTVGGGDCRFYAEVELTQPGNNDGPLIAKSSPDGHYTEGSATAKTEPFPMGLEDGIYHATGRWSVQDASDPNHPRFYPSGETDPVDPAKLATKEVLDLVPGFIELVSAKWEPDSAAKSGAADFVVQVRATRHCTNEYGATEIMATLGATPPGGHWTFNKQANPRSTTVLPVLVPTAGEAAEVRFHLDFTAGEGQFFAFALTTPTMPEHCGLRPGQAQVSAALTVQ